ncbi:unnamed protein product, partial [Amoebophrya sp. A120]|eukprot:GSA120T00023258001.1
MSSASSKNFLPIAPTGAPPRKDAPPPHSTSALRGRGGPTPSNNERPHKMNPRKKNFVPLVSPPARPPESAPLLLHDEDGRRGDEKQVTGNKGHYDPKQELRAATPCSGGGSRSDLLHQAEKPLPSESTLVPENFEWGSCGSSAGGAGGGGSETFSQQNSPTSQLSSPRGTAAQAANSNSSSDVTTLHVGKNRRDHDRAPRLSFLFPKSPGTYQLQDLNLHALGLRVKPLAEVKLLQSVVLEMVLPGDFAQPVLLAQQQQFGFGNYSSAVGAGAGGGSSATSMGAAAAGGTSTASAQGGTTAVMLPQSLQKLASQGTATTQHSSLLPAASSTAKTFWSSSSNYQKKYRTVDVHYIGWYVSSGTTTTTTGAGSTFTNPTLIYKAFQFDTTYNRHKPLRMDKLGKNAYFPGLEEAVVQLCVGSKALAYIPPGKAFGSRGFKALIPPSAHLILWLCVEKPGGATGSLSSGGGG